MPTKINLESIVYPLRPQKTETVDEVLKRYVQFRTVMKTVKKDICDKKNK